MLSALETIFHFLDWERKSGGWCAVEYIDVGGTERVSYAASRGRQRTNNAEGGWEVEGVQAGGSRFAGLAGQGQRYACRI